MLAKVQQCKLVRGLVLVCDGVQKLLRNAVDRWLWLVEERLGGYKISIYIAPITASVEWWNSDPLCSIAHIIGQYTCRLLLSLATILHLKCDNLGAFYVSII